MGPEWKRTQSGAEIAARTSQGSGQASELLALIVELVANVQRAKFISDDSGSVFDDVVDVVFGLWRVAQSPHSAAP